MCYCAAGYVQRDYSVGVLLKDLGKVLTVSYAHNIDPTSSVGAEVTKKLEEKEATVFALGCVRHPVVPSAWSPVRAFLSALLEVYRGVDALSSWFHAT